MVKVELEFKRIQTYLFSSPRLRAMLGANSKLGETVRIKLVELAREHKAKAEPTLTQRLPTASEKDPLTNSVGDLLLKDDPQKVYQEYGVLVRDGGHFTATFENQEEARNFIAAATQLITAQLPGILIEARIDNEKETNAAGGESIFNHPAFQISHQLSAQPASERDRAKGTFIGYDEKLIEEAGKNFRKNPQDTIATLEKYGLIPTPDQVPKSLNDLVKKNDSVLENDAAQGDYLAIVHADGNSIGARYNAWQQLADEKNLQGLEKEIHGEHFFHSMRVAVRQALTEASKKIFQDSPEAYQLLMLGGDDLLLACASQYALPFAQAYSQALTQTTLADGKPLTLGIGVVIAKPSFPFYRLHALADELATSAKQLFRANEEVGSVIDWYVTSNSWVNDAISQRKESNKIESLILSHKPYAVLGEHSLEKLLGAANQLQHSENFARSQLRTLVETLRLGRTQAELTWLELPEKLQKTINELLTQFGYQSNHLFIEKSELKITQSILPDLVEIIELMFKADRKNQNQSNNAPRRRQHVS